MNGISALIRRDMREMMSLSAMQGYSKKVAICKPGRGLSPDPESVGTLILDFLASKN